MVADAGLLAVVTIDADAVNEQRARATEDEGRLLVIEAAASAAASVEAGAKIVDASLGGIGGCPFAPRATGNVPTEDVAYMLHRSGYHTGLDLDRLIASARWLGNAMGRDVPGMLSKAGAVPAKLLHQGEQ